MRTLLLAITALISLALAALGYLALAGNISFTVYIFLSTGISIGLVFLSGHYIFNYYSSRKK